MVEKASSRMQSYIRKIYAGVPLRYENKIKSKHNIEKIQKENVSHSACRRKSSFFFSGCSKITSIESSYIYPVTKDS